MNVGASISNRRPIIAIAYKGKDEKSKSSPKSIH